MQVVSRYTNTNEAPPPSSFTVSAVSCAARLLESDDYRDASRDFVTSSYVYRMFAIRVEVPSQFSCVRFTTK